MKPLYLVKIIFCVSLFWTLTACENNGGGDGSTDNQYESAPNVNSESDSPANNGGDEAADNRTIDVEGATELSVKVLESGNSNYLALDEKPMTVFNGATVEVVSQVDTAIYTYESDEGGISSCVGSCAAAWPALVVSPDIELSPEFSLSQRDDSELMQVSYRGSPLYLYKNESGPGSTDGLDISGWNLVDIEPSVVLENNNLVYNGQVSLLTSSGIESKYLAWRTLYQVVSEEEEASGAGFAASEYTRMCAGCHGNKGNGGTEIDASLGQTQLINYIDSNMPDGNPDACRGECARAIAAYIKSGYVEQNNASSAGPGFACVESAACLELYPAVQAKITDILGEGLSTVTNNGVQFLAYEGKPLHIFQGNISIVGDNLPGEAFGAGPLANLIGAEEGGNIELAFINLGEGSPEIIDDVPNDEVIVDDDEDKDGDDVYRDEDDDDDLDDDDLDDDDLDDDDLDDDDDRDDDEDDLDDYDY